MYLIDRGKLLMQMMHKFHYELPDGCNNPLYGDVMEVIEDAPLIEAEPVKHGEWLLRHEGHGHYWECSVCHTNPCIYVTNNTKYCPNCGAKMDKE